MKKVIKSKIFLVIITMILCISGTLYAANIYKASDVIYNSSDGSSMNVEDALNDIYEIKSLGTATANDIENEKTAIVKGQLITGTKNTTLGGYVALFNGSSSIVTSTLNLSLNYFNPTYGNKNNNTIIINNPGTYRIIGTVSHSPITTAGFTSKINLYINGSFAVSALNNYLSYSIINYKLVVDQNQSYSINATLTSDGNVSPGTRGGMLVIIKEL